MFFDNLSIKHYTGPLLEETHYYPFGLTMAGISSKALKPNYAENKKKYNGIEFENDLELAIYDAQLRELDGQLGRWWEVDPKIDQMEMWSPYVSNYDNPIIYSDLLGDEPECCGAVGDFFVGFGQGVRDAAKSTWNFVTDEAWKGKTWKETGLNLAAVTVGNANPNPAGRTLDLLRVDHALGTDLSNRSDAINNAIDHAVDNIPNMTAKDWGNATGQTAFTLAGTKGLSTLGEMALGSKAATGANALSKARGLGNPFKNATLTEVTSSFEKRVAQGTMEKRGVAYVRKKSGYSYNVDKGGNYGRGGKKYEPPHVDVNYPNPKPKNVPPKKKLFVQENTN